MGVVIFGASSYLVGGLFLAAAIVFAIAFAALLVPMCAIGPFVAFHGWLIGKAWYQKFAKKFPRYMDWIDRANAERRERDAKMAAERIEKQRDRHRTWLLTKEVLEMRSKSNYDSYTPQGYER